MSETNGKHVGGLGDSLFDNDRLIGSELKLVKQAVKNGWNVRPELKQKILDRCELIVDAESNDDIALKAAKIIMEADKIDVARERNGVEEKHNEVLEATAVIRTAMKGVAFREKMAAISNQVCGTISHEPKKNEPHRREGD